MQNFNFKTIGTGSSGNCYLLTFGDEVLVIEAGVNFTKVKKALNFNLSKVVGVLISHEHGDHACAAKDFLKFGKPIYCTKGTGGALKLPRYTALEYRKPVQIGLFTVTPFEVFHDAAEPAGFLIDYAGVRVAFLTDTNDLRTRLTNVDYWVIEANYSNERLRTSSLDIRLKKRIQDSHMSIDRCKTILEAHNAKHAILIHASDNHANIDEFLTKIPFAEMATIL